MSEAIWNDLLAASRARADAGTGPGAIPPHEPRAAVLACSDARLSPAAVFGQPVGALFEVRVAGNTASPAAVASLDFVVENFGASLIVVLGHTDCGAVTAAAGGVDDAHYDAILAPVRQIVAENPGLPVDDLAGLNVARTVAVLTSDPGPAGQAIRSGRVLVRGAVQDLGRGELREITPETQHTN